MKVLLHGWQKNHFIYDGFVDVIGKENVTSFLPQTFHKNYGDEADTYDSSSLSPDDYDLIVFTPRSFYDKNFKTFLDAGNTNIFMDLEDDFFLRNVYKNPKISHYFKREIYTMLPISAPKWYARYFYGSQILPPIHRRIGIPEYLIPSLPYRIATLKDDKLRMLSLSVRNSDIPIDYATKSLRRDIALFFCLTPSTIRERRVYYQKIRTWARDQKINSFVKSGGVPKKTYVKNLLSSRVAVSLRGMGQDTDRYWEIAAHGAALFSPYLPLTIENDFIDKQSAVFFNNFTEFKELFMKYVLHSDEWFEIARKGRINFLQYHTPKERVKQMLRAVEMK